MLSKLRKIDRIPTIPGRIQKWIDRRKRRIIMWWNMQRYVRQMRASGSHARVVIGAAKTKHGPPWMVTDLPFLDVTRPDHWARYFKPETVDRVFAEHVFEHLHIEQFRVFLRVVRPYLAADGFVRGAVPDGNHPDPEYIDQVRIGGTGKAASDHKVLYTYQLMTDILREEGYDYRLLEYFDESGTFHKQDWLIEDGKVRRSAEFDRRNPEKPLTYTSLIVDFWPKKGEPVS